MKKILLILLAVFAAAGLSAQEDNKLLETIRQQFNTATLDIKLEILKTTEEEGVENFGPLYVDAVRYVINNSSDLAGDSDLRELSLLAIRYLEISSYEPGIIPMWRLFEVDNDVTRRIAILNVLKNEVDGESEVVPLVADWVQAQNDLKRSGTQVEPQVVQAAIEMLVAMKHAVCFDVLVDTLNVQYSAAITTIIEEGIVLIEESLDSLVIEAFRRAGVADKVEVQDLFIENEIVSAEIKTAISVGILAQMLQLVSPDVVERTQIREMRYKAVRFLISNPDTSITSLAIKNFNQSVVEYDRGIAVKSVVLEAIALLGKMESMDAALRLSDFLELINTYTEKTTPYDEQIVLAVIQNLQLLGESEVYNTLLYTTYLNYSATIKNAAREAMRSLQR